MKIREGQLALDFTATDIEGREVKLSDFKGQKIILGFYRNVQCPFCNLRIHKIMGKTVALRNSGIKMVFLFESSNQKLKSSVMHQGISPWPLIGNPEKDIYQKYGVEPSLFKALKTPFVANMMGAMKEAKALNLPEDKDATITLIPADFFIDENFRVVKAHYGASIDGHVPLEELFKFAGLKM